MSLGCNQTLPLFVVSLAVQYLPRLAGTEFRVRDHALGKHPAIVIITSFQQVFMTRLYVCVQVLQARLPGLTAIKSRAIPQPNPPRYEEHTATCGRIQESHQTPDARVSSLCSFDTSTRHLRHASPAQKSERCSLFVRVQGYGKRAQCYTTQANMIHHFCTIPPTMNPLVSGNYRINIPSARPQKFLALLT